MRRLDSSRYDASVLWLTKGWLPKLYCTAHEFRTEGQNDSVHNSG